MHKEFRVNVRTTSSGFINSLRENIRTTSLGMSLSGFLLRNLKYATIIGIYST